MIILCSIFVRIVFFVAFPDILVHSVLLAPDNYRVRKMKKAKHASESDGMHGIAVVNSTDYFIKHGLHTKCSMRKYENMVCSLVVDLIVRQPPATVNEGRILTLTTTRFTEWSVDFPECSLLNVNDTRLLKLSVY